MLQKQTVILVGGLFGSGKSTLTSQAQQRYGDAAYNVEFADIYQRIGGLALDSTQAGRSFRDGQWQNIVDDEIQLRLSEGYEAIFVSSAFYQRERRTNTIAKIDQETNVIPLMLAIPQLAIFHRLKEREVGSNSVNRENARIGIHRMNMLFTKSDNTDLLLPTDVNDLPAEYAAMLTRNEINRLMVGGESDDELRARSPRWVVSPHNISPETCVDIVKSGTNDPFLIRQIIEEQKFTDIEGNALFRRTKEG